MKMANFKSKTVLLFTVIIILGCIWSGMYWLSELSIKIYDYYSEHSFLNIVRKIYGHRTFLAWLFAAFSLFDIRCIFSNRADKEKPIIKDKLAAINLITVILSLILHVISIAHILAPVLST